MSVSIVRPCIGSMRRSRGLSTQALQSLACAVQLPALQPTPEPLRGGSAVARELLDNLRRYDAAFQMSSTGKCAIDTWSAVLIVQHTMQYHGVTYAQRVQLFSPVSDSTQRCTLSHSMTCCTLLCSKALSLPCISGSKHSRELHLLTASNM